MATSRVKPSQMEGQNLRAVRSKMVTFWEDLPLEKMIDSRANVGEEVQVYLEQRWVWVLVLLLRTPGALMFSAVKWGNTCLRVIKS